jgi:hypothetical protein
MRFLLPFSPERRGQGMRYKDLEKGLERRF